METYVGIASQASPKFDWHDLSPIVLTTMLLHNLKIFLRPIKLYLLAID